MRLNLNIALDFVPRNVLGDGPEAQNFEFGFFPGKSAR